MRRRPPLVAATALLAATVWTAGAGGPAQAQGPQAQGPRARAPQARTSPGAGGAACSPLARIDGYADSLDKARFHGVPVAGLSALASDGQGKVLALSDRSRIFSLGVREHGAPLARTTGTATLAGADGKALDSEGMSLLPDGSLLVTSETGPSVGRYTPRGRLLPGALPVPHMLRVAPGGRAQPNQTFEGVTTLHGGRTAVAAMEGKLAGDGEGAGGRPMLRFQSWGLWHGGYRAVRQWGYPVDAKLGVSDVAATGDGRLLVLERGYDEGSHANTIRLYLADPRGASDVSGVGRIGGKDGDGGRGQGGHGVRPVRKTLLADLSRCPDLGAPNPSPQPHPLLDNVEGLTVRSHAPGGRLRLLLSSDDNESAQQVTRLYALTVRLPQRF